MYLDVSCISSVSCPVASLRVLSNRRRGGSLSVDWSTCLNIVCISRRDEDGPLSDAQFIDYLREQSDSIHLALPALDGMHSLQEIRGYVHVCVYNIYVSIYRWKLYVYTCVYTCVYIYIHTHVLTHMHMHSFIIIYMHSLYNNLYMSFPTGP